MKAISLVVCAAATLAGCSMNGSTPVTAWGRKDVSMMDYRTDAGQCAVLAATNNPEADVLKNGGTGSNGAGRTLEEPRGSSAAPDPSQRQPASGSTNPVQGGNYRDSASADFVNRAAMQQRTQEMAAQRARNDVLKSCLSNRGYTEFQLSAAQRAELDKLPAGSEQRREYLYKLGTSEEVLAKQALKK
jgi:hypothetical protein